MGTGSQPLVLLPPGTPVEELGPTPGLRLAELPDEGPAPVEAEVVVLGFDQRRRFTEVLPELTRLRLVQTLSAGVEWLPVLPAGVTLCNGSGVHDGPVAEWVLAAALAMGKRLPHFLACQAEQRWDSEANLALALGAGPPADDLAEQTWLIVGYGSIGAAVERRLSGFGTRLLRVARTPRDGVEAQDALPRLLPEADVVVLLAPATPETAGMADGPFLDAMRPGALLVNAARGSLVDTDALVERLHAGRIRAALDVTDPEPLPPGHPLWSAPGVLITPHAAGSSAYWLVRGHRLVGEQLRRYAAGDPLRNVKQGQNRPRG